MHGNVPLAVVLIHPGDSQRSYSCCFLEDHTNRTKRRGSGFDLSHAIGKSQKFSGWWNPRPYRCPRELKYVSSGFCSGQTGRRVL